MTTARQFMRPDSTDALPEPLRVAHSQHFASAFSKSNKSNYGRHDGSDACGGREIVEV